MSKIEDKGSVAGASPNGRRVGCPINDAGLTSVRG